MNIFARMWAWFGKDEVPDMVTSEMREQNDLYFRMCTAP
ncbi:MAG: hypothetical protein RLZZ234_222 [Candidatus Parcubacteria bacterium]|jgi:hypothetical protein